MALAVVSELDEAGKPPGVATEGLLELLLGSKPAAAVADDRLPLAEGDGGAGERYAALGEAGDAFLTSGLCHVPVGGGDKEGGADQAAGEATGEGDGEVPDSPAVVLLAVLGGKGALAPAVVLFVVPVGAGTRLPAVLLMPVSAAPIPAVLLEPSSAPAVSAVLLNPAFAGPVLAVLLEPAVGAPTPVVLLPAAPAKADPPASV